MAAWFLLDLLVGVIDGAGILLCLWVLLTQNGKMRAYRSLGANYGLAFIRDPSGKWRPHAVNFSKTSFQAKHGAYVITTSTVYNWQGFPCSFYVQGNPDPLDFPATTPDVAWTSERVRNLIKSQHRLAQLLAANSYQLLLFIAIGAAVLAALAGAAGFFNSGNASASCGATQEICREAVRAAVNASSCGRVVIH